jgi:Ca2+-binding EF-hand superfamily protein
MTPEEVFLKFDTDGSGYIDFEEYMAMLPQLGIHITEAKAKKYFALADTDGSGEIDFEEFKVLRQPFLRPVGASGGKL